MLDLEGSSCCGVNCVTELKNLAHLDRIVDSSASSVVVIAFYSRVCSPLQHSATIVLAISAVPICLTPQLHLLRADVHGKYTFLLTRPCELLWKASVLCSLVGSARRCSSTMARSAER